MFSSLACGDDVTSVSSNDKVLFVDLTLGEPRRTLENQGAP